MTDFNDRVYLRLNGTAPDISPLNMVKKIWWFEDGRWDPEGFEGYGDSYLTLTEQTQTPPNSPNINLFEVTMSDTGEPLLAVDRGFTIQKDVSAGGFVASNQGELWLGSGRANQLDVPKIMLVNSGASILGGGGYLDLPAIPTGHADSGSFPSSPSEDTYFLRTDSSGEYKNKLYKWNGSSWINVTSTSTDSYQLFRSTDAILGEAADTIFKSSYSGGTLHWEKVGPASNYTGRYFDTLYITKLDGNPGHLDLGDLTVNGNIKSNLIPTAGHYLGTADLQWASVNASQVNSDNYYARYGYETAIFHGTTTRTVLPTTAPTSPVLGEMWLA